MLTSMCGWWSKIVTFFKDANVSFNDIDPSRLGDEGLQNPGFTLLDAGPACMLYSYYALGVYKNS